MSEVRYDVPVPAAARQQGRKPSYPFGEMRVGGYFERPVPPHTDADEYRKRIRAAATTWVRRKASPVRFVTRLLEHGAKVGVWAVEK